MTHPRGTHLIAMAVAVSMAAAACGGGGSDEQADEAAPAAAVVVDATLLPEPLPMPAGSADDVAAGLARRVVDGPDAAAALLTAVRASGIKVVEIDGTTVQAPSEPFQGMDLRAGEVPALAALAQEPSLPLDTVTEAIVTALAPDGGPVAELSDALLADLDAAANGSVPTLRFFARFVAGLGPGDDLLAADSGRDVLLTDAQAALLALRVSADLRSLAPAATEGTTGGTAMPAIALAARRPAASLPCTLGEATQDALDYTIGTVSIGWDQFLDTLERVLPEAAASNAARVNAAMTYAGIVLGFVKELVARAVLRVEVELVGGEPLVRTKSTEAGETRTIEATATYQTGKGQYLNCVRAVLAASGLDVGVPERGPLADAKITWSGGSGFGEGLSTRSAWVELPTGQLTTTTDGEGSTTIEVRGKAQRRTLEDPQPLLRSASVDVDVDVSESSLAKNLLAVIGATLSGPISITGFMVQKAMALLSPARTTFRFQVRDWSADWVLTYRENHFLTVPGRNAFWELEITATVPLDVDPGAAKISGSAPGASTYAAESRLETGGHCELPRTAGAPATVAVDGTVSDDGETADLYVTTTLDGWLTLNAACEGGSSRPWIGAGPATWAHPHDVGGWEDIVAGTGNDGTPLDPVNVPLGRGTTRITFSEPRAAGVDRVTATLTLEPRVAG